MLDLIFLADLLFYLSQTIDLIWASQTSENCMIGVSYKVFMAKDGTKFHIAEIWCGVAERDTSDWQGKIPTMLQKAKRQQGPAVGAGLNKYLCRGCLGTKWSSHSNSISR